MSIYTICEECGYTFDDKEKGGDYFCPQCKEKRLFLPLHSDAVESPLNYMRDWKIKSNCQIA